MLPAKHHCRSCFSWPVQPYWCAVPLELILKGYNEPQTQFCNYQHFFSICDRCFPAQCGKQHLHMCVPCVLHPYLVQLKYVSSNAERYWTVASVHGYCCFFFCFILFFLLPLFLFSKGLSHLMMGEQGKSLDFLFVSLTDHERALYLLLF